MILHLPFPVILNLRPNNLFLSKTITVDLTTQKIFNTEQELTEYKAQLAKEEAERKAY